LKEDLKKFFEELQDCYVKEKREFPWDWERVEELPNAEEFVHYIAYNLSHDVIHGPLPAHLHNRMVLEGGGWTKSYLDYLG